MTEQWVTIENWKELQGGDRVRLYFDVIGIGWLTAAQIALVEDRLDKEPRITVLAHSMPAGGAWFKDMWFEVHVNKWQEGYTGEWLSSSAAPAIVLTGSGIAAMIIAAFAGVVIWLTLRETRLLIRETRLLIRGYPPGEEPEGSTVPGPIETTMGLFKIASLAIIGYLVIKWFKKRK